MSKSYYNEFDPHAAAWLRELIKSGLIADGDVDERSITEVQPQDVRGYSQCLERAGGYGWGDFRIVPCRDAKSRRIGSDAAPLAHGIPRDTRPLVSRIRELGFGAKTARRIIADARRNRGVRLRGYGNAIVPVLTAEFIRAWMEL